MSIYNFAPMASLDQGLPYVTWENAFTEDELNQFVEYCDSLELSKAKIGGCDIEDDYRNIRVSKTSWITNNDHTGWIYDKLAFIARSLNAKFYNFDLSGFVEDMQYTVYDGEESGHYTWHIDMAYDSTAPRKLSIILQLSDPSEYDGGEIQTSSGGSIENTAIKQKGLVVAFPSWMLHRVTPVTKGVRKTLVVWVAGPQFK
jgi:PKHD-type hydroxylase